MENRVGFGQRFIALFLDGIVIIVGGLILGTVFGGMFGGALGGLAGGSVGSNDEAMVGAAFGGLIGAFLGAFLGIPVFAVLYNLIEAFLAASPGKKLMGIIIRNEDGSPAGKGTLFLRYTIKNIAFVASVLATVTGLDLFNIIGSLLGLIVFLGFFMIFGKAKQGLHDKIAKTAVYPKSLTQDTREEVEEEEEDSFSPYTGEATREEGTRKKTLLLGALLALLAAGYFFVVPKLKNPPQKMAPPVAKIKTPDIKNVTRIPEKIDGGKRIPGPDTPLLSACTSGDIKAVQKIIAAGSADLEARDKNTDTPLILSIKANNPDIFFMLIRAGANIEGRGGWGYTPVIAAISYDRTQFVQPLIDLGADVSVQDVDKHTVLDWAKFKNYPEIAKIVSKALAASGSRKPPEAMPAPSPKEVPQPVIQRKAAKEKKPASTPGVPSGSLRELGGFLFQETVKHYATGDSVFDGNEHKGIAERGLSAESQNSQATKTLSGQNIKPAPIDSPQTNSISDQPLGGTIKGIPVSGFKAKLEKEILTLYTGESPHFDYGTRLILFFLAKGKENQDITLDKTEGFQSGSIHLDSKDHKGLNAIIQQNYKIRYITGKEKDYRIPASLRLVSTGEPAIHLEGRFIIATSGLVSHNGVVDLAHDHLDTIEYVAKKYVEARHKGRKVEFTGKEVHSMKNNPAGKKLKKGRVQSAKYSAIFNVDGKKEQIMKMQLAKKKAGWTVVHVLKETQIFAAHELNPPHRDTPPYIFSPMAAEHFEKNFYKGWKNMREPLHFSCGGGHKPEARGYCKMKYKVYEGGDKEKSTCDAKTYLFDKVNEKWKIADVLPKEKKFNNKKNQVEDHKGDIAFCY